MLAGQLYVAYLWTRANADVLAGGNVEYVRAHAETSITGKWDPGYAPGHTIDMRAFRAAAAAIKAKPGPSPTPPYDEEDDMAVPFMLQVRDGTSKGQLYFCGPGFAAPLPGGTAGTGDDKELRGSEKLPVFTLSEALVGDVVGQIRVNVNVRDLLRELRDQGEVVS
jgi:hypothetical protein